MSDAIDRTQEYIDTMTEAAIQNREKPAVIQGTGECWTCGEKQTDPSRRWCDAECRDTWEKVHGSK